jgi:hypothetical protein
MWTNRKRFRGERKQGDKMSNQKSFGRFKKFGAAAALALAIAGVSLTAAAPASAATAPPAPVITEGSVSALRGPIGACDVQRINFSSWETRDSVLSPVKRHGAVQNCYNKTVSVKLNYSGSPSGSTACKSLTSGQTWEQTSLSNISFTGWSYC